MTATLPFARTADLFDAAPAPLPELPATARGRGQLWSDTVFHAVAALRLQLTHRDAAVVAAAANSILELERTRIRHGRLVAGSELVSAAQLEYEADQRLDDEIDAEGRALEGPGDEERTEEQALAEHAEEVAELQEETGRPLPGNPATFVAWQLRRWNLPATAIPAGGFLAHLRTHGVEGEPAKRTEKPERLAATRAIG